MLRPPGLKQPAGKFRQFASFPFYQVDMLEQRLSVHFVHDMRQPVGIDVEIRGIYLENITRENYLRPFPGPCNDGLDFMGRKVLGLVHYEEHVVQAPSPYIRQLRYDQLLAPEHVLDFHVFLACGRRLLFYDGKVIVKRQHVRAYLLISRSRQKAYVLVSQRNYRTRKQYLVEIRFLGQSPGKGQKRFSGTRLSGKGHELYV